MKARILTHLASLLLAALTANSQTTEIKLATILPRGVGQDFILRKLAEDWNKATSGTFELKIAPGAQKDGEAGIVRKLHSKNYQAGLLSAVGLSEIEKDVTALQLMPLVFRNWDEVDHVREHIRGPLESKLRAKGFVLLFWADSGWVNFFSKEALATPDDFKKTKMFCWAGNAEQVEIMKSLGYRPYALETDNIHSGFASGMIESAPVTPAFALGCQIPTVAKHVLNVNWSPIVGAAIVRKDVWDAIPPELQKRLLALCNKAGSDIRLEGRRFHQEALATLAKGPKTRVHTPTPEQLAQWDALGIEVGTKVRGKLVPPLIYDEVQSLLKEYRAAQIVSATPTHPK